MIKKFETYKNPQIGDYVILKKEERTYIDEVEMYEYLISHIGKIIRINYIHDNNIYYSVEYEDKGIFREYYMMDETDDEDNIYEASYEEIMHFGTQNECELQLNVMKYNI